MAASRSLVSWLTRARRASRSFAGASIGMPATESDSCSVVRHNLQPDSISRNSHDVAVGGVTSRACRRDQSMPSTNAASCADVSRIIPSAIGGHRNAPCSRRFQNSTRPEPSHATIFTRSAQQATFCIQSSIRNDRISLASTIRANAASSAVPARQRPEVHFYGGAAWP